MNVRFDKAARKIKQPAGKIPLIVPINNHLQQIALPSDGLAVYVQDDSYNSAFVYLKQTGFRTIQDLYDYLLQFTLNPNDGSESFTISGKSQILKKIKKGQTVSDVFYGKMRMNMLSPGEDIVFDGINKISFVSFTPKNGTECKVNYANL